MKPQDDSDFPFSILTAGKGQVETDRKGCWRLSIPAGEAGQYRLAQLDDYRYLPRKCFHWQPPVTLSLTAQASDSSMPGTWGFGFWNDPFSFSLGAKGSSRRLPVLPNAAWFFYASPQNYLSLRDDLPANGLLAAVFRSPLIPGFLLAPAVLAMPLLALPLTARWLRRLARRLIQQDAARLDVDFTQPHRYQLDWQSRHVRFEVDDKPVFESPLVPKGRLGLVIWIDNQFAAFTSDGKIHFGTLENILISLKIKDLLVR
ncbi:MAG: hypothetical protein ACOYXO_15315 [Chloroflexota bacterium]